MVFDIGGGSTEFAVGSTHMEGGFSTDMGSVRFTEKYIEHDPPRPEELVACLSVAETHLDDVLREVPMILGARQLVGLAGTVSTAAAVEIGLAEYDRDQIHHFRLTRDAIEDVFRTLVTEPRDDRKHNPGLEEGRVDTIVGGMCILARIVRYFDAEDVLVSEADILDGLILSQMP
jgi:exopolyphosphatase/guanosine-5'-triphosphate,3'-diphosphate pyrophosphatase